MENFASIKATLELKAAAADELTTPALTKPLRQRRKPRQRRAKREIVEIEDINIFSEDRSAVDEYIDQALADVENDGTGSLDDVDFFDDAPAPRR